MRALFPERRQGVYALLHPLKVLGRAAKPKLKATQAHSPEIKLLELGFSSWGRGVVVFSSLRSLALGSKVSDLPSAPCTQGNGSRIVSLPTRTRVAMALRGTKGVPREGV